MNTNERDALVARLNAEADRCRNLASGRQRHTIVGARECRLADLFREAAEALAAPAEGGQTCVHEWSDNGVCNACGDVTDSREAGSDYATPQPAEGDGAVACPKCGAPCTTTEEGCIDPMVGDTRYTAYHYTRPAATAQVPEPADYPEPDPDTGEDRGPCCAHAYADGWNHCRAAMLAAAPAAPKGGVVDEALVERVCSAAYIDWSNCSESNKHDCRNIIRAALATGEQP